MTRGRLIVTMILLSTSSWTRAEDTTISPANVSEHPLDRPIAMLEDCQDQFASVIDYESRLILQKRVGRKMLPVHDIQARFRKHPFSTAFRWVRPFRGQEVVFVEGATANPVVIRRAESPMPGENPDERTMEEPDLARFSPRGLDMGGLIDQVLTQWRYEYRFRETAVRIAAVKVNGRPCHQITTYHPRPDEGKFNFHSIVVYIDKARNLPIRAEFFGYPATSGQTPGDLLESITYLDLRVNTGLMDDDFRYEDQSF